MDLNLTRSIDSYQKFFISCRLARYLNIYRKSIEHLSKIYRKSSEHRWGASRVCTLAAGGWDAQKSMPKRRGDATIPLSNVCEFRCWLANSTRARYWSSRGLDFRFIEGPLGRAHRRPSIHARHSVAGRRKEACNTRSAICKRTKAWRHACDISCG